MTPNPRPAVSENGDVIEQDDLLRRLNEVHFNPYTSEASLIREVTRDAFTEIERLRSLLKLSEAPECDCPRCGARIVGTLTGPLAEGSGDGKMREALEAYRSARRYASGTKAHQNALHAADDLMFAALDKDTADDVLSARAAREIDRSQVEKTLDMIMGLVTRDGELEPHDRTLAIDAILSLIGGRHG